MSSSAPWRASVAALALLAAVPAHADQFQQSADGGTVSCEISARELTRFALVGDQFASVSKMSSGSPYTDFTVTHDPLRGDIYVSVPESFAAGRLSFFATTKAGYVYKFACTIEKIDATQVFVTNPALAKEAAQNWERETSPDETVVRLIQAMASNTTIDGFEISQPASPPKRIGSLEVQLIATYRGRALAGKIIRLTNRGPKTVTLTESDLIAPHTRAVSIAAPILASGASTTAYLVGLNEEAFDD